MPSKSKKQHNLMALVANNPKAAKRLGIKQSVGEDFMKADKGKKFGKGDMSKHEDVKMDKKVVKKAVGMHDKQLHGGKKTDLAALKKGGKVKRMMNGGSVNKPSEAPAKAKSNALYSFNGSGGPSSNSFKGTSVDTPMTRTAKGTYGSAPSSSGGGSGISSIVDKIQRKKAMKTGGCVKMARGGGIEKKGKTKGKII